MLGVVMTPGAAAIVGKLYGLRTNAGINRSRTSRRLLRGLSVSLRAAVASRATCGLKAFS